MLHIADMASTSQEGPATSDSGRISTCVETIKVCYYVLL